MYVPYLVLILIPTARPFIDPFSEYLLTSTKTKQLIALVKRG
jgi:hypothetical protein